METPQPDPANASGAAADDDDQDAGPTTSAEQIDQEPERDQAEGEDR